MGTACTPVPRRRSHAPIYWSGERGKMLTALA
jgi:hypothetical protein